MRESCLIEAQEGRMSLNVKQGWGKLVINRRYGERKRKNTEE
jgi:hypothetical protein